MPSLNIGHTESILKACAVRMLSIPETAYVLATAYWETNRTMLPVKEAYWLSEAWREKNLRYYPWYGRGYAQITWEENYRKAGVKVGVDLIAAPDLALDPNIAASILVEGMIAGWFTGRKLSDYFTRGTDYVGARRIINGTDKAQAIADIAEEYARDLNPSPLLMRGDRGADVARLQELLISQGFDLGPDGADGIFGGMTDAAVRQYQASKNLNVDGKVGTETWTALMGKGD